MAQIIDDRARSTRLSFSWSMREDGTINVSKDDRDDFIPNEVFQADVYFHRRDARIKQERRDKIAQNNGK